MHRRSFFTILAGLAAMPVMASSASAAPVLAPLDLPSEMQRRVVVVRRPARRVVVVRRPARSVVIVRRPRPRVCVRRFGTLVCR
jgi:hypothetical protein